MVTYYDLTKGAQIRTNEHNVIVDILFILGRAQLPEELHSLMLLMQGN